MCLDTITKQYKRSRKTVWAWKGFIGRIHLRTPVRCGESLPRGVWIKANQVELFAEHTGESYVSGFHAYATKDVATFYGSRLIKVKLRSVTAIGRQDYEDVLVAKWLFIPKATQNKTRRKRA